RHRADDIDFVTGTAQRGHDARNVYRFGLLALSSMVIENSHAARALTATATSQSFGPVGSTRAASAPRPRPCTRYYRERERCRTARGRGNGSGSKAVHG